MPNLYADRHAIGKEVLELLKSHPASSSGGTGQHDDAELVQALQQVVRGLMATMQASPDWLQVGFQCFCACF